VCRHLARRATTMPRAGRSGTLVALLGMLQPNLTVRLKAVPGEVVTEGPGPSAPPQTVKHASAWLKHALDTACKHRRLVCSRMTSGARSARPSRGARAAASPPAR